ncbi:MAG: NapC/NirT family cytochrome c [bacterium]
MKDLLRKRWVVTTLAIIVIVLGGGFGSLQYTNQPGFCQSCHIMDPFYQSWKASAHSNVACVDCHYAPGEKYKISAKMKALNQVVLYVTGTYDTKFYAHINDASCMTSGCHGTNTPGKTMYNGKVRFDHATHYGKSARGMELRCTSCHSNNIGDQHIAADTTTCYLCHFKDRISGSSPVPQQFCLDCHDAPAEDIEIGEQTFNHASYVEQKVDCQRCHIDAIEGNGDVDSNACLQCHSRTELPTLTSERNELHRIHVTDHKVDCYQCHSEIKHGAHVAETQVKFSCEQCHSEPHVGARELYAGKGGRGVEDMPSSMYIAQVDCIGCHMEEGTENAGHMMGGEVQRPTVQGCVDCHDDIGRDFYEMWSGYLAEETAETTVAVSRARTALGLADPGIAGYAEAQKLVEDAEYNLEFVSFGRGIHNYGYASELLSKSREFADEALSTLGATGQDG